MVCLSTSSLRGEVHLHKLVHSYYVVQVTHLPGKSMCTSRNATQGATSTSSRKLAIEEPSRMGTLESMAHLFNAEHKGETTDTKDTRNQPGRAIGVSPEFCLGINREAIEAVWGDHLWCRRRGCKPRPHAIPSKYLLPQNQP